MAKAPSLSRDYTLSDAFERVGRRLFGRKWLGTEYQYRGTIPTRDEMEGKRAPFLAAVEKLETELKEFNKRSAAVSDSQAVQSFAREREIIESRLEEARGALYLRPPPDDGHDQIFEIYHRRHIAEETLLEAFRSGALKVHDGQGVEIRAAIWTDDPRFRYYIELSMVVNSKTASPRHRFQAARISQSEFEAWIKKARLPQLRARPAIPIREQCKQFLEKCFQETGPIPIKAKLRELANAEIPDLSENTFNSVWAAVAPAEYRKPGRKTQKRP